MSTHFDFKLLICILIFAGAIIQDLLFKKVKNNYLIVSFFIVFCFQVYITGAFASLDLCKNILLSFGLSFCFFMLKIIGAGDAKLFIVISVLLPVSGIIPVFTYSLVWGAIFGLIRYVLSSQIWQLIQNLSILKNMIFIENKWSHKNLKFQSLPYTVPLFFGFLTDWSLSSHGIHFL